MIYMKMHALNAFFLLCLTLFGLVYCQFLTKEEYLKYKNGGDTTKLNPLEVLEAEVKSEGYSLYRAPSNIVDARDEKSGLTQLMVHAARGVKDECKHLIVQGANLELTNKKGETALLIALSKGNYHSAAELLKGHANMHHKSDLGLNALHTAIISGVSALVEAVVRTDDSWRNGVWAAQYFEPPIVDTTISTGMTGLMMCSQDGQFDMAKTLLEFGAQPNLKSKTAETALMYASITGAASIVKLLLQHGADPAIKNELGFTAAIMAANRGHLDVIQAFIQHDENFPQTGFLDLKDFAGHCALDHAILSDHRKVVDALMAAGVATGKLVAIVSKDINLLRFAALERRASLFRQ